MALQYIPYKFHTVSSCYVSYDYIDGLVEDCNISIANALEILQSCTKPSILSFLVESGYSFTHDIL